MKAASLCPFCAFYLGWLVVLSCSLWVPQAIAEEAPAGTSLKHFTKVTNGILAGSKPTRDADFQFLQSQGVRFLLQPRFVPFLAGHERSKAKRYGMEYMSVPINASPFPPSEKHVNAALRIMRNSGYKPLYLHCLLGRDRTSLLVGLYMIYFEGASKQQAYTEMKAEGFRSVFFVHGLKAYFDKHAKLPPELADLAASAPPKPN